MVCCADCMYLKQNRNIFFSYYYCGNPVSGLCEILDVAADGCSYGEERSE